MKSIINFGFSSRTNSYVLFALSICFFVTLFLSCSKNTLEDMNQPIYAMQTAHSDVALGPKPDPVEDCKCYMTVRNVYLTNGQPMNGCDWGIEHYPSSVSSGPLPWAITGQGSGFYINYGTSQVFNLTLPSDPLPLSTNNQAAWFDFINSGCNSPITFDVKITCFLEKNGVVYNTTETYHLINLEALSTFGTTVKKAIIASCYDQPADEIPKN